MLRKKILLVLTIFTVSIISAWSQQQSLNLQRLFKINANNIIMVQDFDDPEGGLQNIAWKLNPSTYITRTDEKPYPQQGFIAAYPATLSEDFYKEDRDSMRVLAIRGAFNQKGYNFIDMIPYQNASEPMETDKEGNALPGIYFDAPLLKIGIYTWSDNRDYRLEAELETSNGLVFTISLGTLQHYGWKVLTADIPKKYYRTNAVNLSKTGYVIKLNKISIWTTPAERVNDFVIYFDTLFVSKTFNKLYYDGNRLADGDTIDSIQWQSEESEENEEASEEEASQNEQQ